MFLSPPFYASLLFKGIRVCYYYIKMRLHQDYYKLFAVIRENEIISPPQHEFSSLFVIIYPT